MSIVKVIENDSRDMIYDGISIVLSDQTVSVFADTMSRCCEHTWVELVLGQGITATNIVGLDVINIERIDTDDNFMTNIVYDVTCGVRLTTSLGPIDIVAHNEHNGFYPHYVILVFNNNTICLTI